MVDLRMVLDAYLDGQGILLETVVSDPRFRNAIEVQEVVQSYGAKFTKVRGLDYIIKNNRQRERIIADINAYEFFVSAVRVGQLLDVKKLKESCLAAGVKWDALQRIFIENGVYLMEIEGSSGLFQTIHAGREMSNDQRLRVMRTILETGFSLRSIQKNPAVAKSVWEVVKEREVGGIDPRHYDLCLAALCHRMGVLE